MCSAQDVPPYLVYTKGTEKRNVKNTKKMKKGVDIWQNIWYSNTLPSDRDRLLKETQGFRKEIKKKFKKVLDKQNTA